MIAPSRYALQVLFLIMVCIVHFRPVSSQELTENERIEAIRNATQSELIQTVTSPDGVLQAEVVVFPCVDIGNDLVMSYEQLNLVNPLTDESQVVTDQLIQCGGLGGFGLSIRFWTNNSEYLFFTDAREGVPDGLSGGWIPPLWRVDVSTMHIERLGQARLSPSMRWLAIVDSTQISVMQVDATERSNFLLTPDGMRVTTLVWLPDESGLIYLQADGDINMSPVSTRSTVTHIDIEMSEQVLLLDTGG
jgi:hypothetical protein